MKSKDRKDLHIKIVTELKKLLHDAKEALSTLRLDKEQNKLKNTREIFNKRKEIAALQTILKEKEGKKDGK